MNISILNRDFQHPGDGWYQIEPKGNHPNADAGVVQVIDDEACNSIVARFNDDAAAGNLPHRHEMLIDREHFSHNNDKETRAFGWLTRLQNRADGIYGQIRWTATGSAAVDGGDYRFFSTEYSAEDLQSVDGTHGTNKDMRHVRPVALSGLSLTNRPNNQGGKPITNRESQISAGTPPTVPATDHQTADIQKYRTMKQIAQRLGLSGDASEEAILGELTKLETRATAAESQLAPLKVERDTLKNRVATLDGEQIDSELDAHGLTDEAIRNRVKPVLLPMTNRADRVEFIKLLQKPGDAATVKPLTNRSTAGVPAKKPGEGKDNNQPDAKTAQKIMNRARELKKEIPTLSDATATTLAKREIENE